MEQFNTPIVGEHEEFQDYDHWEETHDENGDYSATMNIYPDIAFFEFGLYAHMVASGPFIFYLAYYRLISGVPTNTTTETTNLMRVFNDKESLLVGFEKPTWAGWGGVYTTTGPTMYGISFGAGSFRSVVANMLDLDIILGLAVTRHYDSSQDVHALDSFSCIRN